MFAQRARAAKPHHQRFRTEHGAVHVWTPANYDRETAGIVVYVHGYFTDVDDAWRRYHLARQFAESGLNALFIACEAPSGAHQGISWTNLNELLAAVEDLDDDPLPEGRVVVVGHSGAHRTIAEWLDDDRAETIVLVDALYGDVEMYRAWLDADPDHRLINAGAVTARWGEQLAAAMPDALVFKRFPPAKAGKLEGARFARLVHVRSQHDHMELVTGGVAIPMLLRAVQLPIVLDRSRKAPIHAL